MGDAFQAPVASRAIRAIIRRALGPKAVIRRITRLRGGLFNASYKIGLPKNTAVILRVAPDASRRLLGYEKSLLEREVRTLEAIGGRFPLAPRVVHRDFSRTIIDRDYVLLELKEGDNAFYRMKRLSRRDREILSGQLGQIARKIHSMKSPDGRFGPPHPMRRHPTWSGFIRFYVGSLSDDLQGHPYLRLPASVDLRSLAERMEPILDEVRTPRLVHGDLWWRNILIGRRGNAPRITAVLDWDRSLWGDPYFEWILYGMDLGSAFWKRYRTESPSGASHRIRFLLYKTCGGIQAALEDSLHFRKKKAALQMWSYALSDLKKLSAMLEKTR